MKGLHNGFRPKHYEQFSTTAERSEVVESLTRAPQLSGDGCIRSQGCLTFHREQKKTQLTTWDAGRPEVSYLFFFFNLP